MTGTPTTDTGADWRNPTFYRATAYAQERPWHRARSTGDAPLFPALPPVADPLLSATGHLLLPCRRLRWQQCRTCYIVADPAAFARDVLRQLCLERPITGLRGVDLGRALDWALTPLARATGHRTAVGLVRAARRAGLPCVGATTADRRARAAATWLGLWPDGTDPIVGLACAEQCLDLYHALQPAVHRALVAAPWQPTFAHLYAATVGIADPAAQTALLGEARTVRETRARARARLRPAHPGARS